MNNNYDVAIVGGGAGGMLAGIECARKGLKSIILEKEEKLGKKLLATGNGRCNLGNDNIANECYNNGDFALKIINDNLNYLDIFCEIGILSYADSYGRLYPKSNLSTNVVELLLNALHFYKVQIETNFEVSAIKQSKGVYEISNSGAIFFAKYIILATGGNNFALAKNFGHSVTSVKRSLVGFKTSKNQVSGISGVRVSDVTINIDYSKCSNVNSLNEKVISERGEIIFKDDGISGICVMNICSFMNRDGAQPEIYLDLLPDYSLSELNAILKKYNNNPITKGNMILNGFFPTKLAKKLRIENSSMEKLAETIKHYKLDFLNYYDNNQVTSGGVSLNEMCGTKSKLVPHLFIVGEVLDIDGLCGGYNLEFAFTSALDSVRQIAKEIK